MSTTPDYLRTTFLERLAHDLRGAASTATGGLDEVSEQVKGSDGERFAEIARRSIARVLRISTSLAEAAELERGALQLAKADVDLLEIASAAADGARALENRRAIEVLVTGTGRARGDAGRLKRATFELVSNAIRAARSKVTISVADGAGATVTIVVSDDGPGCPPLVPRFTPTQERRGLGLGLAMAMDVARAHGGTLKVERDGGLTHVSLTMLA